MRAALKEPVLRWEWWMASEADARSTLGAALQTRGEALGLPFALLPGKDPRAVGLLTSWTLGTDAREEHKVFTCSSTFRDLAPLLERQVEVRLLATRDLLWDTLTPHTTLGFVEVTRDVVPDATRKRGGRAALLVREQLPRIEGVHLWPVIGHQGRLFAMVHASNLADIQKTLEEDWGPLAEPPRIFETESA